MGDHRHLTPKSPTAQADIRDFFHTSPNTRAPALFTPSHPIAHVRARSDAAHNAMYEEWKVPVYKPRMPRSKSDGNSIRESPPGPRNSHARVQTVDHTQIPIISTGNQLGSCCDHRCAQTEGLTRVTDLSRCSLTSDGETLSRILSTLPGDTIVIDHSLIPKPLKLASHRSPPPAANGCTVVAETDTYMESSVTLNQETQGLDLGFPGLMSAGSDSPIATRHVTTKPIPPRPASRPSRLTWDDEAIIYYSPSPSLITTVPSIPEKARRILGVAGDRNVIAEPEACESSSSQS